MPKIVEAAVRNQLKNANNTDDLTDEQVRDAMDHPPLVARVVQWADERRMLPQAWLAGFLDTWATTLRRQTYLVGAYSETGWWYYFPLAMLFKTPLATLALLALATVLSVRFRKPAKLDRWTSLCLIVPLLIYGASALTTHLNLGLRHVFPIYPILFVWIAAMIARQGRIVRFLAAALLIALAAEAISVYPDYIAFFNRACGGSRGGFGLLGDSNLDWGQDLKLLAKWQQANLDADLYVDYFGGADPARYVKYSLVNWRDPLPPTELFEPNPTPSRPRVLAISASSLQGIYPPYARRPIYQEIARHAPIDVLGGTIYLYQLPLRE